MADTERNGYLRSLMEFDYPEKGIPLEEVESVDEIVKRFKTGACPTALFPRKPMRHWLSL